MKHKIKIIDYNLFYEESVGYFEGDARISIDGTILNVFVPDSKLLDMLGTTNMRGKEIVVEIQISTGIIKPVGVNKKLMLEITYRDSAPNYLFIGEVLEKSDMDLKVGIIVFDCGIVLDVKMKKDYFYEQLEKGEHILVIGRPDIYLVDEK